MSPWFEIISLLASIIGGVTSLLFTLMSSYLAHKAQRKKLSQVQKQQLQSVLDSSDLVIVGKYFDEVIDKCNDI